MSESMAGKPAGPGGYAGGFVAPYLARLQGGRGLTVAGILSGTSADGIDVALARFQGDAQPECLAFATLPFADGLGERLHGALAEPQTTFGDVARLHMDLGFAFGSAALAVSEDSGIPLDLVGSHGQTLWHFDGQGRPATLQLGDGNAVAAAAGVPCVSDFRMADVALSGHGAPLSIHGDERLFGHLPRPVAILNLGGMGNLSFLLEEPGPGRPDPGLPSIAFDTGPAGALLDGLARALFDEPMDRDGRRAADGRVREELVSAMLAHPFFEEVPPRSTGRDTFGRDYIRSLLARDPGLRAPEDWLASGVCAVARSVANALERFGPPHLEQLWLAGGGGHHPGLRAEIGRQTGLAVRSTEECGVNPDAREGLLFACLAVDFLVGRAPKNPGATGAQGFPIFGKWSFAPSSGS